MSCHHNPKPRVSSNFLLGLRNAIGASVIFWVVLGYFIYQLFLR